MKNKFFITTFFLLSVTICLAQKNPTNDFINQSKLNPDATVQTYTGKELIAQINADNNASSKHLNIIPEVDSALSKLDSVHIIEFKDTGAATQVIFKQLKSNLSDNNYQNYADLKSAPMGKISFWGNDIKSNPLRDFLFFIGDNTIVHIRGIIHWEDIKSIVEEYKKTSQPDSSKS